MKKLFLTSLLFLSHKIYAVEEIDARQRCVDHAISLINQRQDLDVREKRDAGDFQNFFNTSFQVERERIAHERAKKNPTPVGHTEEFVLNPSSVFHGTTLLCNLVKTNNIVHTHFIPLFIELQKATKLLYQESACYRYVPNARRSGALEAGEQTFQKGSHRRQGAVSVVVPHAHQSEGSLMARSGRMIQNLLKKIPESLS